MAFTCVYHTSLIYDGIFGLLDFRPPLFSTNLWPGYCSTPSTWTITREPVGRENSPCPCQWSTVSRRTCCTCSGNTWPLARSTGQRLTAHACPGELTLWREKKTWSQRRIKKSLDCKKNKTLQWARWLQRYNLHKPWWTNLLNCHPPINDHLIGRHCQES